MADGDSGDTGDMEDTGMDSAPEMDGSAGYGGNEWANNEHGPYSSPDIQAGIYEDTNGYTDYRTPSLASGPIVPGSFSNTGAPGSKMLDESGDKNRNAQRAYNQSIGGGAFTPLPGSGPDPLKTMGYPQPGTSKEEYRNKERSMMLPQSPKTQEKPKEKPPAGGGGGISGPVSRSSGIPDTSPHYRVMTSPFPFQPVVPVADSGVKRSFFNEQTDLLKAMMPYWMKR